MAFTTTNSIPASAFPEKTIQNLFLVDAEHLGLLTGRSSEIGELKTGRELINTFRTKLSDVVSKASKAVGASTDASDATAPMICLDMPAPSDGSEEASKDTKRSDLEVLTERAMQQTAYQLLRGQYWASDGLKKYANRVIPGRRTTDELTWAKEWADCLRTDPTLQSIRDGSWHPEQEGTGGADASQSSAASASKTPAQPEDTVMRDADEPATAITEGSAGGLGLEVLPKEGDERGLFV